MWMDMGCEASGIGVCAYEQWQKLHDYSLLYYIVSKLET